MKLCVNLVWLPKIIYYMILIQNMFKKLFGLSVFCINFCRFSKNPVFQNFDQSNVFFDWSKIPYFLSLVSGWFDWSSIGSQSIKSIFLLVETNFPPIEILSVFKENLLSSSIGTQSVLDWSGFEKKENKTLFLSTCSSLFQIVFFPFCLFLSRPIKSKIFCRFPPQIFKGFCPQV